jgi:hypothetical protein
MGARVIGASVKVANVIAVSAIAGIAPLATANGHPRIRGLLLVTANQAGAAVPGIALPGIASRDTGSAPATRTAMAASTRGQSH